MKKILLLIIFILCINFNLATTQIYVAENSIDFMFEEKGIVKIYDGDTFDYINELDNNGTKVRSIYVDNNFIFVGSYNDGTDNSYLKKYDRYTYDFLGEINYGDSINSIVSDDTYIYFSGGLPRYIRKYNKVTLDFVDEVFFSTDIYSIVLDGDYLYAGGSNNSVRKYNKNTFELINTTPSYGNMITTIKVDENYIYVGGFGSQRIRKYDKNTMEFINETISYGGNIWSFDIIDDKIYVGGASINRIRIYDKDTMSFLGETSNIGDWISSVKVDDNYFYFTGGFEKVYIYDKNNYSYYDEINLDGEGSYIFLFNYEDKDIYGCMNETANNYDPLATIDDGSCEFDEETPIIPPTTGGGGSFFRTTAQVIAEQENGVDVVKAEVYYNREIIILITGFIGLLLVFFLLNKYWINIDKRRTRRMKKFWTIVISCVVIYAILIYLTYMRMI